MDILLLTTPAQHSHSNPFVITQTKELQAWCDSLPTMNVIDTVNLLKKAIPPFNELKLKNTDRFKLLEIYRNTFDEIISSYDELRLRTLPISPEKRKVIAEDIMWLYLDLANGYKIIIKEAHETSENLKNITEIVASTYRAMELLITSLLYAAKAHVTQPPLVIFEIKQLYNFSESQYFTESKIKAIKDRLSPATVGNLFKQFILFCTIQNDTFASEDILEFFTILDFYSLQTEFISQEHIQAAPYLYIIDMVNDTLPAKITRQVTNTDQATTKIIDISRVIKTMRAIIQQKSDEVNSYTDNKENVLLNTYITSLNSVNTTKPYEKHIIKQVKLVKGIDAVHYFLEHIYDVNELFQSEINNGIEVQNINFDENILSNLSDWILTEETDTARILTADFDKTAKNLKADDFVALIQQINHNQPPVIITGIIRKIKTTDDNQIKLAIEILPGQPLPFSYIRKNGREHVGSGLYFPPITALKKPASLVITRSNYVDDMNCSININKQDIMIQATNTILETGDFTQFNFSTLN